MTPDYTVDRLAYIAMAAFLATLLLIGTFFDEAIASVLFLPHSIPATLVTTVGIYPFAASMVLFMGAMYERLVHSRSCGRGRTIRCIAVVLAALLVGFVGAASLLDVDCLGGILPSLNRNIPAIAVVSLIVEYPLFAVGFRLAEQTDNDLLFRRALCLVVVLFVAFLSLRFLKGVFNRPRYRTVALGYEGIGFVPWYTISPDPSDLMAKYGLAANEFSSFPSGHGVLSISTTAIFPSLAWLFPRLRDKQRTLCVAGFVFALVIMLTRLILGAHYLSDVCAGALIGLAFVLANDSLQRRIGRGRASSSRLDCERQ